MGCGLYGFYSGLFREGRGRGRMVPARATIGSLGDRSQTRGMLFCMCVHLCVCATTINCQSSGDPPPLSSSDRIPQVLGFVFETAVRGEEKQTGRHFPNLCVFFRRRKHSLCHYFYRLFHPRQTLIFNKKHCSQTERRELCC